MYCKIIGQLSTEFLLTNILLDREALSLLLPQQLVSREGVFLQRPQDQGGDQPLLVRRLLLFQSCITTAVSEILAPSCLIAWAPAPASQREMIIRASILNGYVL